MSTKLTAEKLAQRAFDLGLLDERQLQEVWAVLGSRSATSDAFLQQTVRREFLTNYQAERLIKGDRHGFFFGEYKVMYLVGSGTFARVYRAEHRETGQLVAVKVLRNRYSDNPEQFEQFVREGALGCTLRHPNIVPIHDVFSRKTMHFLVMDFVEGRNLREFVKVRKKLEAVETVKLMADVTAGLQYAFERELTHRDLKMSNVLISADGQAKLVDFGLATIGDSSRGDSSEEHSARAIDYAGLERATGVRRDDTRSDIYFCGCMLYHMLTGQPPLIETRDRVQRLSKGRFTNVPPIQQLDTTIPAPITAVVNKAMTLNAERRYQTPGAMMVDLRSALKRLSKGSVGKQGTPRGEAAGDAGTPVEAYEPSRSVMVVESNPQMQDVFRSGLKRAGYRVLLTSDPHHALRRFEQNGHTADCVVINCQDLGEAGLTAFNEFGDNVNTGPVPALLLLGENQREWAKEAHRAKHRMVLAMPLTMKKLRAALIKLAGPV